ncbi:MAG: hypothetical protein ACE5OV_04500, partial [Candidatus Bathyarchaeia archaeon]
RYVGPPNMRKTEVNVIKALKHRFCSSRVDMAKARMRLPTVKPATDPNIKGSCATSERTAVKEASLCHQASTDMIRTTTGPTKTRTGVRRLISSFLLAGEPKKYCTAKDAMINPMKTEKTKGLVRIESLTTSGMGTSKLF